MKILVTGAKGFIARNLIEQLGEASILVGLSREELNLLDSDQVMSYLKEKHFDVVIHTATYDAAPKHSTKDPLMVFENNMRMFFNLARAEGHFGRMIFFGSGAEFGREHWKPKMKECHFDQYVPSDPYGYSKYLMTLHAMKSDRIFNLRLFGVFGKYDDWRTRFIPNACCHAVMGLPIRIDQNRFCDYLAIGDLAKVVRWFLTAQPKHRVYNVCSGQSMDSKTLAEMILRISRKSLEMDLRKAEMGPEYSGDNALLFNELKEFKLTPMEDSLKELYAWYDANKILIEKDNKLHEN